MIRRALSAAARSERIGPVLLAVAFMAAAFFCP